jgi:outer membrane protein TolC
MNHKSLFILLLLSATSLALHAQVTIEDCYREARDNYPLIKQYDLIERTGEYNIENAAKGYLPQVLFSAKATYQSDVTKIPIHIDGVKGLSKDQYGLTMEVDQTLWDGGVIKSHQEEMRTANEVNRQNLEVSMYAIRQRINQLFFGALLMDAHLKENDIYQDNLSKSYNKVSSYVRNGIAHQADLDAVKVEMLKAKQTQIELTHTREAYIAMLSTFTGTKIAPEATLVKPGTTLTSNDAVNRPELALYDARIRHYEAQRQVIRAGLMPHVGLFVTGGYGKPGLNMLDNSFAAYYIGGVRLTWNLSNLYTKKNDRHLIDTNISMVQAERDAFLLNTRLDVTQKASSIDSYRQQLKYDDDIIALRSSVRRSSEVKMADGTLSGIDLVRDINSENMAKQDKDLHEIQMLLEMYNLKYATNN